MTIPFINLKEQYSLLKSNIDLNIQTVLDHGQYILGPEVGSLESKLAEYVGAKYCISVASGTDALMIALMAIDIKPGDEVITTPFTFVSTVEVIALLGAKPIFVDIDPNTCNINASLIQEKLTLKTRAIIPVSLYGQPSDMDEINAIASKNNLVVIEDAAQSFGSTYKDRKSCNLSEIGCTSFFPSKPLGCYGDGGAIFTDNDEIYQAATEIRVHGQSDRYIHSRVGLGGRMDTLQAAILLAKLENFTWEVEQRSQIGARYNQFFDSLNIPRVTQDIDRTTVFAQYTIFADSRDDLVNFLNQQNIPTAIHYPVPMNAQAAYKHFCCLGCTPTSDAISNKVLSLPMSPYLSSGDQDHIIESINSFYSKFRNSSNV
jgi:UDP-2-acetamido-2-deoxy-ribo-hexuluronate aminotransferase